MAIYEFGCGSCKDVVEKRQSYDDPPPTCCGVVTTRLISMPGSPVFCGSGTYATDYGNMAHHLSPRERKVRNSRNCRDLDLQIPKPQQTNPDQAKQIKELSERGRSV